MVIFKSEKDIIEKLNFYDQLVFDCADEKLEFWSFIEKYGNFFQHYALDGHESDDEEFELLKQYEKRILFHEELSLNILADVCSDEDAIKPDYIKCGRYGSVVAMEKIVALVERLRRA